MHPFIITYATMEGSFEKKREGERIVEKFFKLNEKGSNVKTELIAGLTTFLAMAYILGLTLQYWQMLVWTKHLYSLRLQSVQV